MRLLIRADSGVSRGAGHVMRSLAIAEAARRRGWTVTLSADVSTLPWLSPWLAQLDLATTPPVDHVEELATMVRGQRADIVLLDHYGFGDAAGAVADAGALLANIEDGPYGRRPAAVSIDYALGAESAERPGDGSGVLLRGIAYAPIREQVRAARAATSARSSSAARSVAVAMGGTDPLGLTSVIVERVEGMGLEVVTAPSGLDWAAPLAGADAVISSAGVSAYELCCLGIPTGLVQVVDNQDINYTTLTAAGAVTGLGEGRAVRAEPEAFVDGVRRWLSDLEALTSRAARARALVDGRGAERIVSALARAVA